MKTKMMWITAFLLIAFAIALPVFVITQNNMAETVAISIGVTLYHFSMRLYDGKDSADSPCDEF